MKPGDLVRYRSPIFQEVDLDRGAGIVTEAFQDWIGVTQPTGVRNWVMVLWPWGLSSERVDNLEVIREAG